MEDPPLDPKEPTKQGRNLDPMGNRRRFLRKQWTKLPLRHERPFVRCFCQVRRPSIEFGKRSWEPSLLSSVLLLLRLLGLSS